MYIDLVVMKTVAGLQAARTACRSAGRHDGGRCVSWCSFGFFARRALRGMLVLELQCAVSAPLPQM